MDGKICLVTGANSGLGKATAAALVKAGASVIMLCRDRARGEAALAEVKSASGSSAVELALADLSSQASIRNMLGEFKHDHLDVLINNAGVYKSSRVLMPGGLEAMFATNHLGHFLLTTLLLDKLRAASSARVITITAPSTTHLNFDDLQGEKHFSALEAFGASKMCNLLFAYELSRRLDGTSITSNAFHPGLVKSNIMAEAAAPIRFITNLLSRSPEQAAKPLVNLALSPEFEHITGKFIRRTKTIDSNDYSKNPENQRRLWEVSERLVR